MWDSNSGVGEYGRVSNGGKSFHTTDTALLDLKSINPDQHTTNIQRELKGNKGEKQEYYFYFISKKKKFMSGE